MLKKNRGPRYFANTYGCVQIQRPKSPFQKLAVESVKMSIVIIHDYFAMLLIIEFNERFFTENKQLYILFQSVVDKLYTDNCW